MNEQDAAPQQNGQDKAKAKDNGPSTETKFALHSIWRRVGRIAHNGLAALGLAALLFYIYIVAILFLSSKPKFIVLRDGDGPGTIIEINVTGMIVSGEVGMLGGTAPDSAVLRQLRQVQKEDDVVGVLLRVNSPGGVVTASDILHHEIKKIKARGIPVVALFEDLAASGAYYLSAPADWIIAHPTTLTGSIGVILTSYEASALLKKLGIRDQTITSGKNKGMLSISKPISEEQRKLLQVMIDQMYERFVEVVAEGRKLDKAEVRLVADGRILTARQAKAAKLIDDIGYYDDAVKKLIDLAKLEAMPQIVRYRGSGSFLSVLTGQAGDAGSLPLKGSSEDRLVQALSRRLSSLAVPRLMYLWQAQP